MGLASGSRHQAADLVENKGMFFYKLGDCILAGRIRFKFRLFSHRSNENSSAFVGEAKPNVAKGRGWGSALSSFYPALQRFDRLG